MNQQTQLQELESTIHRRRLYLQGQDNQIQRNLALLKQQQTQLDQNEAELYTQISKLTRLTTDHEAALTALRIKAEQTPTKRFQQLTEACDTLKQDISKLERKKRHITKALDDSEGHLEQLDMDIIEADAIYQELSERLFITQKKCKQAEHDAEFQTAIVADLRKESRNLLKEVDKVQQVKLTLEKEYNQLDKDMYRQQQNLKSIESETSSKSQELKGIYSDLKVATEKLKSTIDKDKNFRKGLAEEKLHIQSQQENIKSSKQAIKQEIMVNEHLYPKWQPPVKTDEPKHFKL